jgi:hypothetical protein
MGAVLSTMERGLHGSWIVLFFGTVGWNAGQAEAAPMIVLAARDAGFYRRREGSAVELPNGDILLAWSRFSVAEGDDNGRSTIVAARSVDVGKTWSAPVELPVGTAGASIRQAGVLPVKQGLTLSFSVRGGGKSAKYAIDSLEGGLTWSERRKLFEAGGPNDRVVRLRSGRIVMPAHRVSGRRIGGYEDLEVLVARGDDDGRTWELTPPLGHVRHPMEVRESNAKPLKLHEPAVAELDDGRLLMLARSSAGASTAPGRRTGA